jgi:pheophorbide a oxygenase
VRKEEEEEEEEYGVDDESGEEVIDSKFTWRDHWYPVSLLEDLDPLLPTPFQLLGRDLVLWFDKANQEWVAFDDKCPHRLAPLSVSLQIYALFSPLVQLELFSVCVVHDMENLEATL